VHLSFQQQQEVKRRIMVQASLEKNVTRAKRAGGVAQEVECLPRKQETLSSNPRLPKKKKYLCVHLSKYVLDVYVANYKTFMKTA
jgi:hypothetical protein